MPAVTFRDVTWTYAGSKGPAISDINLEVQSGEAVLVTGPAGAGKTTLCCCLNGLIPNFYPGALEGKIVINEKYEPRYEDIANLSRIVGIVLQDYSSQLLQPTVIDDVAFALENFGFPPDEINRRAKKAIEAVRLNGFEERNPHTLSGGEQQLCAIASIIALDPDIYVLDEPISALDPIGGEIVSDFLKTILVRKEKTFIIVEHRLEEFIPWIDKLVVMDKGRIILEGEPHALLSDDEKVELMRKTGINLPQLTLLAYELRKKHIIEESLQFLNAEQYAKTLLKLMLEKGVSKHGRSSRREEEFMGKYEFEPIIKVENLTYIYPSGVVALKDINLEIYSREFVAIVGQNGSGKTTLLKHFNGLLKPTRGKVIVKGIDTSKSDVTTLSQLVGLTFQHPDRQLFRLSVKEEVGLGLKRLKLDMKEKERRALEVLRLVNLEHAFDDATFSLSLGERKRLALAAILAMDPEIVLVDEPTTGQDLTMRIEIMNLLAKINKIGKTVIVVTHDMDLVAKYAKRVVVMGDGRVLADGPIPHVLSNSEVLSKTRLKAPPVVRLFQMLSDNVGIPLNVLTVEEAVEYLERGY